MGAEIADSFKVRDILATFACTAHFFLNAAVFSAYPVVAVVVGQELELSATEMGLLMSTASISYAIMQMIAGFLTTKYNKVLLLSSSALLMAGGSLMFALLPGYGWLLASRVVVGIGAGFSVPTANNLLSELMSDRKLSKAMGVFGSGWGLGTLFSFFVLSLIAAASGWRVAMIVVAAIGVIVALAVVLTLRGNVPKALPATEAAPWNPGLVRPLIVNRSALFFVLVVSTALATQIGMTTWAPVYLQSQLASGAVLASMMTGILGLVWIVSSFAGGVLEARLGKPLVIISSMAACVVLPLLMPFARSEIAVIVLMILLGWFTMFWFGPTFSMVPRFVPKDFTGVATGLLNGLAWVGPFLSPFLFGVVLDLTGSYLYAFGFLGAFALLGTSAAIAWRRELGGGEVMSQLERPVQTA